MLWGVLFSPLAERKLFIICLFILHFALVLFRGCFWKGNQHSRLCYNASFIPFFFYIILSAVFDS